MDGAILVCSAADGPFADVVHDGVRHVIGQANNVFVFPGIGMGTILSGMRQVDDTVFLVAARTLAECVSEARLAQGALVPDVSELRAVSARVAAAVLRHASARGVGRHVTDDEAERAVAAASWYPDYAPIEPV